MKRYFITGIGTDVGKTIASAILTEALQADYWKPIQSGELDNTDTMKVKALVTNGKTTFFPEAYRLPFPLSPHASAKRAGVTINISDIISPETNNHLIIEGAGGVMVPINENGNTIADLIMPLNAEAIIVSRHYLGSINHTLLTISYLKHNNIPIKGIIYNGTANPESEDIISRITGLPILFSINHEEIIDKSTILKYAKSINISQL